MFIGLAKTYRCLTSCALATGLACSSAFLSPLYAEDLVAQNAATEAKEKGASDQKSMSLGEFLGTESLSFFGSKMEEAMNSHFLERFNFRQYGFSVTDDGFTEILMRLPRLKPGRPFVTLTFALDQSGKIVRSTLVLKRRYIEDKIHGAFARDYAKSFVQAAVSFKSQERVDSLANEIFYRQEIKKAKSPSSSISSSTASAAENLKEGDIFIAGSSKVPELPKHFSEMYKCFLGNTKAAKMNLDDAVLKFSNEKVNGEDALVIVIEAHGFEHSNDAKNVNFENLPMHVPSI